MKTSLETKALVCALAAAMFVLGGAWGLAASIRLMPGADLGPAAPEIEVSSSPEVVHEGAQFFGTSCTECHGDEGPDLHNLAISNARISATIHKGVKGEMPSFAKKYDDKQIGAIVSYLRTLR